MNDFYQDTTLIGPASYAERNSFGQQDEIVNKYFPAVALSWSCCYNLY